MKCSPIKTLCIFTIKIYQKKLSKYFGNCRFHPTCSEYAILAIEKYGVCKGIKLTCNRLHRCRPDNLQSCIDYP